VASVAADTSAIAPPPPLPSRPDAAPSGASSGFAGLLEASSPPPAPQPSGASATRSDDGANASQTHSAASNGTECSSAAGGRTTTSGPRNCKDAGAPKSTNNQKASDEGTPVDATAAGVTVLAGLPVPPFAFAPLPIADQTPAGPQDKQVASTDPPTPTHDDPTGPSGDRKDASAASNSVVVGLAAVVPGVPSIPATSDSDSSASARTAPVGSLSSTTPIPAALSSPAGMSGSSALLDVAATDSPSQPSESAQPNRTAPTAAQDLLAAVPGAASTLPPAGGLQTDDGPTPPLLTATIGASDQPASPRSRRARLPARQHHLTVPPLSIRRLR
jgi:hypothetical protein